jgi:hypothetical protein
MTTLSTHRPSSVAVRHRWVPAVGALAGAALAVKYGLMMSSGDGAPDSTYAFLWFAGTILGAVAGIGLGLRRHPVWQRLVVALVAPLLVLAWIMGVGEVLEPVAADLGHTADEAVEFPLGVLGVVLLAAAYVGFRHDQNAA